MRAGVSNRASCGGLFWADVEGECAPARMEPVLRAFRYFVPVNPMKLPAKVVTRCLNIGQRTFSMPKNSNTKGSYVFISHSSENLKEAKLVEQTLNTGVLTLGWIIQTFALDRC
jgi:hypothetical protein